MTVTELIAACKGVAVDRRYPVAVRQLLTDIAVVIAAQETKLDHAAVRVLELQHQLQAKDDAPHPTQLPVIDPQATIDEPKVLPPRQVFSNNMGFFLRSVPPR
jgi:hypothetical protein